MANKLYQESSVAAIAAAIRAKNGSSDKYTIGEMAPAILGISGSFEVPEDMCFGNSDFTKFPEGLSIVGRVSCLRLFIDCTYLTEAPLFDTSSTVNMREMFYGCDALVTVPQYNTSAVKNMSRMFAYCSSLPTVPLLDTTNVTNMQSMFSECSNLATVPQFDTSSVTNFDNMFYNNLKLANYPVLDFSSATSLKSMFNNCMTLSNDSLQNILKSLLTADSYTGTKRLSTLGIIFSQAAICKTFPEWSILEAEGWS